MGGCIMQQMGLSHSVQRCVQAARVVSAVLMTAGDNRFEEKTAVNKSDGECVSSAAEERSSAGPREDRSSEKVKGVPVLASVRVCVCCTAVVQSVVMVWRASGAMLWLACVLVVGCAVGCCRELLCE